MKKKSPVPAKLKPFVVKLVNQARDALCLHEWTIDVCYEHDEKWGDDAPDGKKAPILGEAVIDRRYLRLTIHLYPPVFKMFNTKDVQGVRDVIYHEISHVWTEHMKDLIWSPFKDTGEAQDAWESLTQRIASLAIGYTNTVNRDKK